MSSEDDQKCPTRQLPQGGQLMIFRQEESTFLKEKKEVWLCVQREPEGIWEFSASAS